MEMIELKHCFYPAPAPFQARIYFEEKYSESVGGGVILLTAKVQLLAGAVRMVLTLR